MNSMNLARKYERDAGLVDLRRPDQTDVLIVNAHPSTNASLANTFRLAGYQVMTSSAFYQAKHFIRFQPRLLIVDVRLGEFNGLHLAWHRRFTAPGPTLVTSSEPDVVLEYEARKVHALWFLLPANRHKLLGAAVNILGDPPILASHRSVRGPRAQLAVS